jgi:hypothetical protein
MWWVPFASLVGILGPLDRRCGVPLTESGVLTKVLADGLDDDVHARRRDDTIRGLDDREIVPKK